MIENEQVKKEKKYESILQSLIELKWDGEEEEVMSHNKWVAKRNELIIR